MTPTVRRIGVGLALASLFVIEYELALWTLPDRLDARSPATARLAQDEILLQNATPGTAGNALLSGALLDDALVDIRFDRARLAPQTLRGLRALGLKPPDTLDTVDYIDDTDEAPPSGPVCRTFFTLAPTASFPNGVGLHLFQAGRPGGARERAVVVQADGVELAVAVNTVSPKNFPNGMGCRKRLQLGASWQQGLGDSIPITILAAPGSAIHFRFLPVSGRDAPWLKGTDASCEPFALGGARWKAAALLVAPLAANDLPAARPSARAAFRPSNKGDRLNVAHLLVGSDTLQAAFSGYGYAVIDGQREGRNLLDRLGKNPLFGLLFGGFNVALLAWAKAAWTPKPPPADTKPPAPDEDKPARRSHRNRRG